MSTLLERMIQRTRGPLSSLEPVATPAVAGRERAERTWEPVADEIAAGPQPDAGLPRDPRREPPTANAAVLADSAPVPAPAQPSAPPETILAETPVPAADGTSADSIIRASLQSPPARRPAPSGSRQQPPHDDPALAWGFPRALRAESPTLVRMRDETGDRRPAGQARPHPGRREAAPLTETESAPEITISIGHIEVRSEPVVAPQPPRPASQPKVSLADFLSRSRQP